MPVEDSFEAVNLVFGELPDLPYLPELPHRGLGADMVGRAASLLLDMAVEWQPHGWTIAARPGRDQGRARDYLRRDLDALVEHAQDASLIKVQVCGPLTLGAALELPNLHKVLTDRGAFRDLADSLAEGVAALLANLAQQLPSARFVLQVDEPAATAVLNGEIRTPSGYGTVGALDSAIAEPALAKLLGAADPGYRAVHCCAASVPFQLFAGAGANAVSVDLSQLRVADFDAVGQLIDDGRSLWLGVVPGNGQATGGPELDRARLNERIVGLWRQLGFDPALVAESIVPTPTCGLAGASPAYVRASMRVLNEVGRSLLG